MIQGDLHGTEWLSLATRYINRVTLQVNHVLCINVIPCDVLYFWLRAPGVCKVYNLVVTDDPASNLCLTTA